jgi:hypothetical protein
MAVTDGFDVFAAIVIPGSAVAMFASVLYALLVTGRR